MEAYTCEDSGDHVTKCDCPDDLCNVNKNAAATGGAPNWLAAILATTIVLANKSLGLTTS